MVQEAPETARPVARLGVAVPELGIPGSPSTAERSGQPKLPQVTCSASPPHCSRRRQTLARPPTHRSTNDNGPVSLSLLSEKVPIRVAYALLVEDAERFSGLWRRAVSGHGCARPCGN